MLALGLGAMASWSASASAHSDLDFTLPTDGAAVGEPVAEITVGFSDPVTLVGPGFEVLDPQGNLRLPFVVTDDDRVFRLQLDPPIGGGEAGVRYEVRAEDGHSIDGGFSFTITAEAPTTSVAPATTPAPTASPTSTTPPGTAIPPPTASPTTPTTVPPPTTSPDRPTAGESVTSPPTGTAVTPTDEGGGSSTGFYLAVAVAVAVAAGAFLVLRSRRA